MLERVVALPYALEGNTLRIAVADPATCTRSTSFGWRRATSSSSVSPRARTSRTRSAAWARLGGLRRRAAIDEEDCLVVEPEEESRRPRGRRRHLGRAARPARQLDHLPGGRGRGQRHPLRAAGGRARRPAPHRRRAARGAAHPEADDGRRDYAPEGAREARHRRAPQAAGRPHLAQRGRGRPHDGRPRRDAADRRGRGGRHASARQVEEGADADRARPLRRHAREDGGPDQAPDRRDPRHRADRLRQVDDALRGADRDQPPRDQHHHRRGSGRVPARRRQPGADQPARRPDLRGRAALDPALRPRRGDGRRDPRRRDGQDLDRGRADRPPRALDAAHERRARRASRA